MTTPDQTLALLTSSVNTINALTARLETMPMSMLATHALEYARALADINEAAVKAFDVIDKRTDATAKAAQAIN